MTRTTLSSLIILLFLCIGLFSQSLKWEWSYAYLQFNEKNILNTASNYGEYATDLGDFNGDGHDDFAIGAQGAGYNDGRIYIYYGGPYLDDIADLIIYGDYPNSGLGRELSGVGDLNGDGFNDLAAGYHANDGLGSRQIHIYYGSFVPDAIPDLVLEPENLGSLYSISEAGDVNNDNFDDIIIGDSHYYENTGRAFIYYGGIVMDSTYDFLLTPHVVDTSFGGQFGNQVACAGDLNNDGFDDVLVGAKTKYFTGAAYIFFGGEGMDNNCIKLPGIDLEDINYEYFGYDVSGAGDINNDGFDDIVVGTAYNSLAYRGHAYIYLGADQLDTMEVDSFPDITLTGDETTALNFGSAVSDLGDVNNDGFDDIVIGALGTGNDVGQVFVYFGGSIPDSIPDLNIVGEPGSVNSYDYQGGFGATVSGTGDINNDGYDDILVGNYMFFNHAGKCYVYFGGNLPDSTLDMPMEGEAEMNFLGYSNAIVKDINNDGYDDMLVGAPGYKSADISEFGIGRVYVYLGGVATDSIADIILEGDESVGNFGWSVASAGDFNNDSYNDILVGAFNCAYIYFGGPSLDNIPDIVFEGDYWRYILGNCVAPAGDVNNDGFDDVIIGAWGDDDYKGQAFLFFGNDSLDNIADVSFGHLGDMITYFGYSVSGIGDYNNDGYDDVAIGDLGSNYNGCTRIYLGGEAMDSESDFALYGEHTYSNFSRSICAAGDFNNDGIDDFISGDETYNNTGRVYLYLGSDSPDSGFDLFFDGESEGDCFGWSVSGGTDFNEDGISDIAIGACGSETNTGKTYVYFGGETLDNVPDIIFEGETLNDKFGFSVSASGDINGDNKADILTGAYEHPDNGAAYLFISPAETGIEQETPSLSKKFRLEQNYPNPFNPTTIINYQIKVKSKVDLTIYNNIGQKVTTLISKQQPAGDYSVQWNAANFASGVYFYHLKANQKTQVKKMLLIR